MFARPSFLAQVLPQETAPAPAAAGRPSRDRLPALTARAPRPRRARAGPGSLSGADEAEDRPPMRTISCPAASAAGPPRPSAGSPRPRSRRHAPARRGQVTQLGVRFGRFDDGSRLVERPAGQANGCGHAIAGLGRCGNLPPLAPFAHPRPRRGFGGRPQRVRDRHGFGRREVLADGVLVGLGPKQRRAGSLRRGVGEGKSLARPAAEDRAAAAFARVHIRQFL